MLAVLLWLSLIYGDAWGHVRAPQDCPRCFQVCSSTEPPDTSTTTRPTTTSSTTSRPPTTTVPPSGDIVGRTLTLDGMPLLKRGATVIQGQRYGSGHGDVMEAVRGGILALEDGAFPGMKLGPIGQPVVRHPDMELRVGQLLYYGWGGVVWNAGLFKAVNRCTTGFLRDHHPCVGGCIQPCTTSGCTFIDGTCTIQKQASLAYPDVTDGTALLRLVSFDPVGGAPIVREGRKRMGDALTETRYGDNDGPTHLEASGYSYADGPMAEMGEWTVLSAMPDPRTGLPNFAVGSTKDAWSSAPGFAAYTPQQGWAPDVRPAVRLVSGGSDPAGTCVWFRAAFMESQAGGRSLMGPPRRACTTTAGQRFEVGYPKDALAYQQLATWGGTFYPVICRGSENEFYLNRVEILQAEDETVVVSGGHWPETETCLTSASRLGLPVMQVMDPTNSAPQWQPNTPVHRATLFEVIGDDGACRFYAVWGINYDGNCRNGTTGLFNGVTGSTPPRWSKKWERTCDDAGTAYQLRGWCDTAMVITQPRWTSTQGAAAMTCVEPSVDGLRKVPCR